MISEKELGKLKCSSHENIYDLDCHECIQNRMLFKEIIKSEFINNYQTN